MKIAVAQLQPDTGQIAKNVVRHIQFIRLGIRQRAELIVFPELSLTGYEPQHAVSLARETKRLNLEFIQSLCEQFSISVAVGTPWIVDECLQISSLVLRPNFAPLIYSKRFLHDDEKPYFKAGKSSDPTIHTNPNIALAICFELSVEQHAQSAFDAGCKIYIASVAKTAIGMNSARRRAQEIASKYSAIVMIANCLGVHNGDACAGQSSAWNRKGELIAQFDSETEGLIVVDSETEEISMLPIGG